MRAGWVESVPNVSEGRRPEVVARIAGAASAAGARVLDVSSDADHNRSVITLAGPAGVVGDAAVGMARAAVELIDLRRHRGVHPRMGAIDVIPFIPLDGAGLDGCVALARETGRRIGDGLGLPVYLYGAAAREGRPAALVEIRDGGFEALAQLGAELPPPDFGPPGLHASGGGVAVGARPFLVAFNLMLEGATVEAARRIARRVRASTPGGLPGVLALGFWLEGAGRAQVSLNLVDLERTTVAAALRRVREEAAAEGVGVASVELVGLAPRAALAGLEAETVAGVPGDGQTIEARLDRLGAEA